jgi:hypothetical protein
MSAVNGYRALTDIDIIAVRPPNPPGPEHHHLGLSVRCIIVTEIDSAMDVDATPSTSLAEVRSLSRLQPCHWTPGALHAACDAGDLYTEPHDEVVDRIIDQGVAITPTARVRLVVFAGHGRVGPGMTVHLGDAARFIRSHLASHQDLYRVTRFSDPVVGLLTLLDKVG